MTTWGNEDDGWLEQAYEDRQTGGYEDDLTLVHDDPWEDEVGGLHSDWFSDG